MTVQHGVISYLFLDFRRDERPTEFWITLLLFTAGGIGALYVVLF